MKLSPVRLVVATCASALITLALPLAASAQTLPSIPSIPSLPGLSGLASNLTSNLPTASDLISQIDANLYAELNANGVTHIQFQPHIRVCAAPGQGGVACDARVITDKRGTPVAAPKLPKGYGPTQFRSAYGVSGTASGHPVIAIVDAYDDANIAKDLTTYSTTYGLPQLPACKGTAKSSTVPCFEKVNQTGQTTRLPAGNAGWDLEISLDVETTHALCGNCTILLVEANSSTYQNLMTAVNEAIALGATAVSNSYGGPEFSGETAYDSYLNHPGVAITFSAGDSGYGVEYPAASKYVTAVGGTSLFLTTSGAYQSELAWSGTGSGCSAYEGKPSQQKDTSCARRTVTDVSADADPNTGAAVYDTVRYDGVSGWFQVGGTSLASPIVAATYVLSGNVPAATLENSLPYAALASLHDVTSGSNGSCGGSYLCTAVAGYDGPTGLGSPSGTLAF